MNDRGTVLVASRSNRSRLLAGLICVAVLQLNLQKVFYWLLGIAPGSGDRHPVLFLWTVLVVVLWVVAVLDVVKRLRFSPVELTLWLFATMLVVHAAITAATSGLLYGAVAFISWGAWLSLYFIAKENKDLDWPGFYVALFVFFGLLNALPVLYEISRGVVLFKFSTVAGVYRYFGISQSVSILGLQLAVGALGAGYLWLNGRFSVKLFALIAFCIQATALVVSSSRGPLIFLTIALLFMAFALRGRFDRKLMLCLAIYVAVVTIGFMVASMPESNARLVFLLRALTFEDEGNITRLTLYAEAMNLIFRDPFTALMGFGSGSLSHIPAFSGGKEFGVESSLIKLLLECGLFGLTLFALVFVLVLAHAVKIANGFNNRKAIPVVAIALVVLMESAVHESLKSWLISWYFWATLAAMGSLADFSGRVNIRFRKSRTVRSAVSSDAGASG